MVAQTQNKTVMELFYHTTERTVDANGVSQLTYKYNPITREQISFRAEVCKFNWDNYNWVELALVPYYKGVKLQLFSLIPSEKSFRGKAHYQRMNSTAGWDAISPEFQGFFNLPRFSYYS